MGKPRQPRIAIIGAGFAGIATAVYLSRAGLDDFVVLERSAGPGGVWWDSRYPGAAVDTPTHMYSFSFRRNDWTKSHADQNELQKYIADTIEAFDLGEHFRFNTMVKSVTWLDERQRWMVATDSESSEYDYVISAVGLLNVPKFPDWPGLDEFEGVSFHTAEWPENLDLAGKTVSVVGTGSTSAQIVPAIAGTAAKVVVYQREPGWINPKPVHQYSDQERAEFRAPWRYKWMRLRGYIAAAQTREGGDVHKEGSAGNLAAMAKCEAYIQEVFKDRPDLVEAVTPKYPYFGKRPIKDSNFYPALLRDDVELVPHGVDRVTRTGIVDAEGVERPTDVMVMATGFQANIYLSQLEVRGRGQRELHDYWNGEPAAFLGMMVDEYPNFFILYGPNTNGPVTLFMLETQAKLTVKTIRRYWRKQRPVEVRRTAFAKYDAWMQRQMEGSVWSTSNNYFKTPSGRVVTQWPVNPIVYWVMSRALSHVALRALPARASGTRRRSQ